MVPRNTIYDTWYVQYAVLGYLRADRQNASTRYQVSNMNKSNFIWYIQRTNKLTNEAVVTRLTSWLREKWFRKSAGGWGSFAGTKYIQTTTKTLNKTSCSLSAFCVPGNPPCGGWILWDTTHTAEVMLEAWSGIQTFERAGSKLWTARWIQEVLSSLSQFLSQSCLIIFSLFSQTDLILLELQSRFGDKLLGNWMFCPQNGTDCGSKMVKEGRGRSRAGRGAA